MVILSLNFCIKIFYFPYCSSIYSRMVTEICLLTTDSYSLAPDLSQETRWLMSYTWFILVCYCRSFSWEPVIRSRDKQHNYCWNAEKTVLSNYWNKGSGTQSTLLGSPVQFNTTVPPWNFYETYNVQFCWAVNLVIYFRTES